MIISHATCKKLHILYIKVMITITNQYKKKGFDTAVSKDRLSLMLGFFHQFARTKIEIQSLNTF